MTLIHILTYIDMDECSEEVTLCEHTCTNTVGSYSCTCKEGYHLHTDGHSCIGELVEELFIELFTVCFPLVWLLNAQYILFFQR